MPPRNAAAIRPSSTVPNGAAPNAAALPVVLLEPVGLGVVLLGVELDVRLAAAEGVETAPVLEVGAPLWLEVAFPAAGGELGDVVEAVPLEINWPGGAVGGGGFASAAFTRAPVPHGFASPFGCVGFGGGTSVPFAEMAKRPVHMGLSEAVDVNW